jgi:hypothetical protein
MELVIPGVGAVVKLDDPLEVAKALDDIRDLERQFREIKAELTRAIVHASQKAGTKTLHMEGMSAEVKGGSVTVYDEVAIEEGLRACGMPEERIREIVVETISYKVSAVEAKRAAAANPAYGIVIHENSQVVESPPSVSISRKR